MKAVKVIFAFVVFYFVITAITAAKRIVLWLSVGNQYIEYGLYGLLVVLTAIYIVLPILDYMNRPSLKEIERLMAGDGKVARRIRRHLMNTADEDDVAVIKLIDKKNVEGLKAYVKGYMIKETDGFDKIIKSYAFKLTSTVLLSPNSFIDGLAILYGNSSMIYELTKRTKFRYTGAELFDMYFSVLSIASVSGLLEEFDDELEEIIRGVAEEFSNAIGEETGRTVGDVIPFLNVAVRASTILFQAAGNYAFVIYNGKRYKYKVRSAVDFSKKTETEIRKQARKEARRSRYIYVQEMVKRMGKNGAASIKDLVSKKNETEEKSEFFSDLDEEIVIGKKKGVFGFFRRG